MKMENLSQKIQQIEEYLIQEKEHEVLINQQAARIGSDNTKFEEVKENVQIENIHIEKQVLSNEGVEQIVLNNSNINHSLTHKVQVDNINKILSREIESISEKHHKNSFQDNRNSEINGLLDSDKDWSLVKDDEIKEAEEKDDIL